MREKGKKEVSIALLSDGEDQGGRGVKRA